MGSRMIVNDVTHACRLIARRRGFSIAVITTIALGVSAATSVFAVSNALLLRALPYAGADRLVRIFEQQDIEGFSGNMALGNLDDWCGVPGIEACGAYAMSDLNLAGDDASVRVRAATATPGLFAALRVLPTAGRLFTHEDADAKAPVALLSASAAARLLGSSAAPVGRTLRLDGVQVDVIGVLPDIPGFDDVAVWRAAGTAGQSRQNHSNRSVARLRPGVTLAVVQQQLDAVSLILQQQFPKTNAHWWGKIEPLQASMTSDVSPTLRALAGLTGALLLLCAVSAASLIAGRAGSRQHELSIRLALGAGRHRLVTQLCVEGLLLALGGALLGTAFAGWIIGAVVAVLPSRMVLWRTPDIDLQTLLFAVTAAVAASILFGLLPAIGVTRRSSGTAALQTRVTATGGNRLRSALTAVQAGLATVLLVAAALLGAVLIRVLTASPGFRTDNVLTFSVTAPRAAYADAPALTLFFDSLTARLAGLPQVESVGAALNLPMSGSSVQRGVIRFGDPLPQPGHTRLVLFQVSTPGYLRTLGLRLLEGRDFTDEDTATAEPVALINAMLAAALWPGEHAVGRQLLVHTDEKVPRVVIGVIADATQARRERQVQPEYYVPLRQSAHRTMTYALHLRGDLTRAALQGAIADVDRGIPPYEMATMDTLMNQSTSTRLAVTRLSTFFGVIALLLASIGLYGLVASTVTERRREIGIRLALGAPAQHLVKLVLRRGLAMAVMGAAAGLMVAIPVTTLLGDLLGDEPPSSLMAMTVVFVALVTTSLVACWMPARAALHVDPVTSLRSE
jgi:putative ABC transport system permease protein